MITSCVGVSCFLYLKYQYKWHKKVVLSEIEKLKVTHDTTLPRRKFHYGWYIVKPTEDVPNGKIISFRGFGKDWILYRTKSNKPVIQSAYCKHMGSHLGDGTLINGKVQCHFHGWKYDENGKCGKHQLETVTCIEKNGLIFGWFDDDPTRLPEFDIPDVPGFMDASFEIEFPIRNTYFCENQVDKLHFKYVHEDVYPLTMETEWKNDEIKNMNDQLHFGFVCHTYLFNKMYFCTVTTKLSQQSTSLSYDELEYSFFMGLIRFTIYQLVSNFPIEEHITCVKYYNYVTHSSILSKLIFKFVFQTTMEDIALTHKMKYRMNPLLRKNESGIQKMKDYLKKYEFKEYTSKVPDLDW
jgi:nitrite reductase/ring-hydroxylating ferredoxin subunit